MAELLTFKRFVELESRVRRIERYLHLQPEAAEVVPTAPVDGAKEAAVPMAARAEEPPTAPGVLAEATPPHVVVPPPLPTSALQGAVPVQASVDPMNAQPAGVLPYRPPTVPTQRKDKTTNFEQLIGLNWTGWVGAIVLVIGAALGIKYAYDLGWLSGLPKEVRLGFCFAAGLSLLGLGEWVDRKINRVSAACIFGAGVATLFVVSYAGFGYFDLYAQSTAFVLMAISTFIGAGVAMRKNLVSIAVLSLLGGNLAPIILQTHEPRYAALLGYVLTLQVIALVLTAWGNGGKWWVLRGLAILMPTFWIGVVYAQSHETWLPIEFSIAFAVLSQAELIVSAGRLSKRVNGIAAASSILVTSLLVLSLTAGLESHGRYAQGTAILVTAAACGMMAIALWKRRTELAMGFRIQSAILVLVSVPVMLDGRAVILTWGGLSLAYAIVGRQIGSKWGRWFAAAAWAGAVLYFGQWCANEPAAREMVFRDLPVYLALAACLTAIGHALTWIVTRDEPSSHIGTKTLHHATTEVADERSDSSETVDRNASATSVAAYRPQPRAMETLCHVIDFVAGAVVVVALIDALPAWYATAAIAGYAWLLLFTGRLLQRPTWAILSGAAMLFALVKWGSVDMLANRLAPTYQPAQYLPVANPIMGVGTLLAGSIMAMYALQRQTFDNWLTRRHTGSPVLWVGSIVLFVMTFGLSMEVDRMVAQVHASAASPWPWMQLEAMGFSMLWTAALAIQAGLVWKLAEGDLARRRGFVVGSRLMAVVAIKFVLLDVLVWWVLQGAAAVTPVGNLQLLTGVIVSTGLGLFWWLRDRENQSWRFGGALMLAILLLCGTVEIDRAFEQTLFAMTTFENPTLAKQVAISIYWALFAVGSVIGGFRFRIAGLRYFGLGLLAIALGKVVVFDLHEVGRGYRILSFLGLGALLLATSVVYGKLSPKLLGENPAK